MSRLTNWARHIRARLGTMAWRGRLTTAGLAVLVLAGAAWLVLGSRSEAMAPVSEKAFAPEQLVSARAILEQRSIPSRVVRDRLLVPRDALEQVRSILAYEGLLGRSASASFEQLSQDDDIWRTQSQNDRRWQAAKMATLSRLIANFPTVRSATVIIEPGNPKGLGRPAVEPTAAVHVSFKGDCLMTATLARAIADLVGGSVAGLKPSAIRIVDSTGASCRVDDAGAVVVGQNSTLLDAPLARPGALHAPGAALAGGGRSYSGPGGSALPARVLASAMGLAGVLCGYGAIRRRLARQRRRRILGIRAARVAASAASGPARPFAFLQEADVDEILALVRDEHPQTLALVLSHLDPEMAAAVLKALPPDRQAEVAQRVVELDHADTQAVAQVEAALADRVAAAARNGAGGGIITMAQILQHAGYATEKTVLDALAEHQPSLARAMQQPAIAFEDISRLGPERLREALSELGSDELAIALRTAGKPLKDKVLACLPARMVRQVRREMDQIGPVRLSDVEAAQQHVVEAVRRLEGGRWAQKLPPRSEIVA